MTEDTDSTEILTLGEAARFIRVSEKTLGEMARMRRIPSQKVGREWRFLRSALWTWLAGNDDHDGGAPIRVGGRIREADIQYELFPSTGFRDTAFAENHDRTLHRWVPWIAGFSASFVADALDRVRHRGRGMRVLDPFAGVGTTPHRSAQAGRRRGRLRSQPLRGAACRVKAESNRYDVGAFEAAVAQFEDYGDDETWMTVRPSSSPPVVFVAVYPFSAAPWNGRCWRVWTSLNNEPQGG